MSETEQRHHRTSSGLAVFGDPVAGRALALLLQGVGHEARFVPATLLNVDNPLDDIGLIVLTLTPELSAERRESLLGTLREAACACKVPILKLMVGPDVPDTQTIVGSTGREYVLPWPCSREELLRNVKVVLSHTKGDSKG